MNESDVRLKLIDPVLKKSWDADNQIFTEYYFTDGEIIVRKNLHIRKKPKKADYLLMYRREMPIAIVEAKDSNHTVEAGLQQAMDYAIALDVPFAYSSNGKGFAEHDFTTGKVRRLGMDQFRRRPRASFRRPFITSAAATRPATISATRSTERSKRSPRARTGSFSSWPPARVRRTPPFR